MTGIPVRVLINSVGTWTVTITRSSGGPLTVYTDRALTTPRSMPATITATATFFVPDSDQYTVSVKQRGREVASAGGQPRSVWLGPGQALAFGPEHDGGWAADGTFATDGAIEAGTEVRADGLRVGYSAAPPFGSTNSNGSLNQYGAHDLLFDPDSLKTYTRSLILTDVGDPPDLCLRRANLTNQSDYPQGTPAPIEDGQNMGTFYWMGWAETGSGNGGFQTRAAQIYTRSKGDQDLVNHGGELHVATAPQDTAGNPQDALVVRHNGNVDMVRTGSGFGLPNHTDPPSAPASGMGQLYVEDGALKYRSPNGTVTTIGQA